LKLALGAIGVAALLTACSENSTECARISKNEAIKLAVSAKPKPERIRAQDRPIWASDRVRDVELNDGRGWGAAVHFEGNGAQAPLGFIYEDCEVGWSLEGAQ
jgi:hypothetical protein